MSGAVGWGEAAARYSFLLAVPAVLGLGVPALLHLGVLNAP